MVLRPASTCCCFARARMAKRTDCPCCSRCRVSVNRSALTAMFAKSTSWPRWAAAAAPPWPTPAAVSDSSWSRSAFARADSRGQPVRGGGVLGVHFSRRVEDGGPNRFAVGGELLHEPEALPDLEDRHVDVRPVLELQEGQSGLARDVATVGSELVEEERHEVQVAALPGPRGLGRGGGGRRRGRLGRVLEGLPDRARVEEAEVPGLLPDAVLVHLDLVGPEVADGAALLVPRHHVEEDDLGVHAEDIAPELGRWLRPRGLARGGHGGEGEGGRGQPRRCPQRPASSHGFSSFRGTPCSRASEDLDDGPRSASSLRRTSRSRSASAGRPARA